jgi:hypothetical protein
VLGQHHLGLRQQVADGCAQLVRQIRGKLGQAPKVVLQALQHVVERQGQVRHFNRHGIGRHAFIELVGIDRLGARLHGPQGL